MNTTQTTPRIVSITFETTTCDRCGGTGTMPYTAYNGVCLKCNRRGTVYTPKGRAAAKKAAAWKDAHASISLSDLAVGDRIYVTNMRGARVLVTVTDLTTDTNVSYRIDGVDVPAYGVTTVDAKGNETTRNHTPNNDATYQRALNQDDLQALAAHLSRNSGAIVTTA